MKIYASPVRMAAFVLVLCTLAFLENAGMPSFSVILIAGTWWFVCFTGLLFREKSAK